MSLELAFHRPVSSSTLGHFERENLDAVFLAWLLRYAEVRGSQEEAAKFREAASRVPVCFNLRASAGEKLAKAY